MRIRNVFRTVIYSFLILLSTLFCLNQLVIGAVSAGLGYPFHMGLNYMILENQENRSLKLTDIVDLQEDRNITIITKDDTWNYNGLYDPRYRYVHDQMLTYVSMAKYFSIRDYASPSNEVIVMDNDPENPAFGILEGQADEKGRKITGVFTPLAELYDSTVDEVRNMAETGFGKTVYLDSDDRQVLKRVSARLEEYGWKEKKAYKHSLAGLVSMTLNAPGNQYRFVDVLCCLSLYLLFLVICLISFHKEGRRLALNLLYSGERNRLYRYFLCPFVVLNCISAVICVLFSVVAPKIFGEAVLETQWIVVIGVWHFVLTSLLYFCALQNTLEHISARGEYHYAA